MDSFMPPSVPHGFDSSQGLVRGLRLDQFIPSHLSFL